MVILARKKMGKMTYHIYLNTRRRFFFPPTGIEKKAHHLIIVYKEISLNAMSVIMETKSEVY